MRQHALPFLLLAATSASAQSVTNIAVSPPQAEQVIKGLYDPASYAASNVIDDHGTILCDLRTLVDADSLRAHIEALSSFHTRHAFSDTLSPDTGIGAARRWVYDRFQQISAEHEQRLIPGHVTFDYTGDPCGADGYGWRNVIGVLPGANPADTGIIIIEAHLDSRCADPCDATCIAHGADDNGSGSALVIELARVLCRYTFDHTIVFMLTTGEEQGLVGAVAMAEWCQQNSIPIKAVQNNDIVGGIWCGETSSEPGCPVEGQADSTQVRLFSNGSINRTFRGFARSIKLWYQEKLQAQVPVPMAITIMGMEDRENRGGDHIPFRERLYRNVRFTSANEHGNANTLDSTYTDHQHTSGDVIGVDTDDDLVVDSFFVDFNYLQRNTVINGMAAAILAMGPEPPDFAVLDEPTGLRVLVQPRPDHVAWRVGVRTSSVNLDFDHLYRTTDTSYVLPGQVAGDAHWISVASIDADGITSPFSHEVMKGSDMSTPPAPEDDLPYGLACAPIIVPERPLAPKSLIKLTCSPDPFDHATDLIAELPDGRCVEDAHLIIRDAMGAEVRRMRVTLQPGRNTVHYVHTGSTGLFTAVLMGGGKALGLVRMMVVR